jgi:hypothetical protein
MNNQLLHFEEKEILKRDYKSILKEALPFIIMACVSLFSIFTYFKYPSVIPLA